MLRSKGPLAETYWAAVLLVVLALTPFLAATTAIQPLQDLIAKDTGLSLRGIQLGTGLANAAYSFGSILAIQLAERLPQRRLLVVYVVMFIVGTVMVAASASPGVFQVGHVLQGLATGAMLVAAVPPLITNFETRTVPATATTFNIGLFGAVALGPVIGGASAATETWRPLFWIVAALAVGGLALTILTYDDQPPKNPDGPVDIPALILAAGGGGALFFGVSQVVDRRLDDLVVAGPMIAGIVMIVLLFVHESRTDDPLIPVRKLARSMPMAGVVAIVGASAGSVALIELTQLALDGRGLGPLHAGFLFWPQFLAAAVAAVVFRRLFTTRFLPVLAVAGLVSVLTGGAILTGVATGGDGLVLVGSAFLGFGVAASVSPAFYVAAFTVGVDTLDRVFAVVEYLRGAAAFTLPPLLLQFAMTARTRQEDGINTAVWIAIAVIAAGLIAATAIWVLGRTRLQAPDMDPWFKDDQPAVDTPALAARLAPGRRRSLVPAVVVAVPVLGIGGVGALVGTSRDTPPRPVPEPAVVTIVGRTAVASEERIRLARAAGSRLTLRTAGRFLPVLADLRAGRIEGILVVRRAGSQKLYVSSARTPAGARQLEGLLSSRAKRGGVPFGVSDVGAG